MLKSSSINFDMLFVTLMKTLILNYQIPREDQSTIFHLAKHIHQEKSHK